MKLTDRSYQSCQSNENISTSTVNAKVKNENKYTYLEDKIIPICTNLRNEFKTRKKLLRPSGTFIGLRRRKRSRIITERARQLAYLIEGWDEGEQEQCGS